MLKEEMLNFVTKEFKQGKLPIQLKNYKKLLNYLEENKITLDIDDAYALLLESDSFYKMVETLIKNQNKIGNITQNELMITITSAYELKDLTSEEVEENFDDILQEINSSYQENEKYESNKVDYVKDYLDEINYKIKKVK